MPVINTAVVVSVQVWDNSSGLPRIGDADNLTLKVISDGVLGPIISAPEEIHAVDTPGEYRIAISAAENNGSLMNVHGISSTANTTVTPSRWRNAEPAGDKVCTITVEDGDTNPIGSCPFILRNAGGQVLYQGTTHDSTGEIVANLDEANGYVITLGSLGGYSFSNPYTINVGAAAAQSFTLTAALIAAPSAPANPSLCRVYTFMKYVETGAVLGAGDGTLNAVEVLDNPSGDDVVYSDGISARSTDANGYVYIDIVKEATVLILATWVGTEARSKRVTLEVPTSGTYDIGELLRA